MYISVSKNGEASVEDGGNVSEKVQSRMHFGAFIFYALFLQNLGPNFLTKKLSRPMVTPCPRTTPMTSPLANPIRMIFQSNLNRLLESRLFIEGGGGTGVSGPPHLFDKGSPQSLECPL